MNVSLLQLFSQLQPGRKDLVGQEGPRTNAITSWLMDRAGNPFGTYGQEENCVHCGQPLLPPGSRALQQRLLTRLSVLAQSIGTRDLPQANWIHLHFKRQ